MHRKSLKTNNAQIQQKSDVVTPTKQTSYLVVFMHLFVWIIYMDTENKIWFIIIPSFIRYYRFFIFYFKITLLIKVFFSVTMEKLKKKAIVIS